MSVTILSVAEIRKSSSIRDVMVPWHYTVLGVSCRWPADSILDVGTDGFLDADRGENRSDRRMMNLRDGRS
jgi:hypothetical protein